MDHMHNLIEKLRPINGFVVEFRVYTSYDFELHLSSGDMIYILQVL